jgi:hypothetical protein
MPGVCLPVTLKLASEVTVSAGRHTGVLVFTSTAGVTRLTLTVTAEPVPPVPPKTAVPGPALETASLKATRNGPVARKVTMAERGLLPLKPPNHGEDPYKLTPKTSLGSVWSGTERAEIVVADGDIVKRTDVWLLPVDVKRTNDVGEFSGKLDVAGDGKHLVPITLTISDRVCWPLITVVLGALLAFLAQLWLRRGRVSYSLYSTRRDLPQDYKTAGTRFANTFPTYVNHVSPPTEDAVNKYRDDVAKAAKAYAKSVLYYDTTSDAYKAVLASLMLARRDIDSLEARASDQEGLGARLTLLDGNLQAVITYTDSLPGTEGLPAIIAHGNAMTDHCALEVGGALELADQAKAHAGYCDAWIVLAKDAVHREWEWAWLHSQVPTNSARDRAALAEAGSLVGKVERDLFEAATAADLAELSAETDLWRARIALARLSSHHGAVPSLPEPPSRPFIDPSGTPMPYVPSFLLAPPAGGAAAIQGLPVALGHTIMRSAVAGAVAKAGSRVADFLVVVFTLAVGVLTALAAFYFGKTFGTLEDYGTAFLAGAASTLLVGGLAEIIGQMRSVDAGLIGVSPPGAAKAEIKAGQPAPTGTP